jgi:hypothetical protein
MKKIILFFLISFCIVSRSYAAPGYGPRMPKEKQFFAGLQTYSVFKRSLEKDYGKIRSLQNFFLLSYGVFDWLSIDLKGGAGDIKQRNRLGRDIDYSAYLAGGYGFRIRLYKGQKTKMIFGFQHISVHPSSESVDGAKHKAVLDDWQFSLLASYDCLLMTPYIGTRWSRMDNIHWIDKNRKREKSELDKSVGLIIGTDIPLGKKVWFNLEGQFIDAPAVAGSLNFAF